MWVETLAFDALKSRGCWKVEFFSGGPVAGSRSPFDVLPLHALVRERKETVDPQALPDVLFNYLGLEHVEPLTGVLVNFLPVPGREVRSRSKTFRPGDVLYGRLRPYLNKVYVAAGSVSEGICSGEFYVLIPDPKKILPHVLRALLASEFVLPHVGRWQTGSALPRLQLHDLLEIAVPVPPLAIQKRYEEALVRETAQYQNLVGRVSELPRRIMCSLVEALNEGSEDLGLSPVRDAGSE